MSEQGTFTCQESEGTPCVVDMGQIEKSRYHHNRSIGGDPVHHQQFGGLVEDDHQGGDTYQKNVFVCGIILYFISNSIFDVLYDDICSGVINFLYNSFLAA